MLKYIHYELDGHVIATYDAEPTFLEHYMEVDIPDDMECYEVDLSGEEPLPLFREYNVPIFEDIETSGEKSIDEQINALKIENEELRETIDIILTEVIPSLMEE